MSSLQIAALTARHRPRTGAAAADEAQPIKVDASAPAAASLQRPAHPGVQPVSIPVAIAGEHRHFWAASGVEGHEAHKDYLTLMHPVMSDYAMQTVG